MSFLIFNYFDQFLLFHSFLNDSNGSAASVFYISIRTSFQTLACISLSWSDGHLGQLFPFSLLSLSINLCEKWHKLVYLNMCPLPCCDPPENACNHCFVIFWKGGKGKGWSLFLKATSHVGFQFLNFTLTGGRLQ